MIPHDSARSQFTALHHRAASVSGTLLGNTATESGVCSQLHSKETAEGFPQAAGPYNSRYHFPAERSAGLTGVHVFACAGGVRPILKNVCIVDDIPAACKET